MNFVAHPSTAQKILYLSGKRASPEHRDWLTGMLRNTDPGKLGVLLALPNAVVVAVAGLLSLAIGEGGIAVFLLVASPVVLLGGALIPAITRRRAGRLKRRNRL